ncbi:hypothetical protein ACFQH9_22805 [Pseudonocardia lutea]|jgi:hypothetical protein|uniref:Uncharacterized protein n=1 Tax=Pseudonocardia lutea TaxID=2172015 RepID=A0ABW1IEK9_9PSEU
MIGTRTRTRTRTTGASGEHPAPRHRFPFRAEQFRPAVPLGGVLPDTPSHRPPSGHLRSTVRRLDEWSLLAYNPRIPVAR